VNVSQLKVRSEKFDDDDDDNNSNNNNNNNNKGVYFCKGIESVFLEVKSKLCK
jgi:hypothetical protein